MFRSRKRALSLVILLTAALVAGCGGSARKIDPLPELTGANPARPLWQARVGSSREFDFVPAVVDDAIFAGTNDGSVVRLDAATGRERWRASIDTRLSAGAGADGSRVAVGTLTGEVVSLDAATGKVLWRSRVSSEVIGPPLIANDLVVVRSSDTRLFGLGAEDGKRRWLYQRAAPALVVRANVGAVLANNMIYTGFPGGKLVALNSGNGGIRWEGTVALPKGTTELERVSDVVGFPWLAEREVCAVAFQGRAACFDSNTGGALWSKEISSASGLGGDPRLIFVSEAKGAVSALERSTGNTVWRQDKLGGRTLSPPLSVGQHVIVGDHQGNIHLLSRETGSFVGRFSGDGSAIVSPPVRIPNGFVVQTRSGMLYAYSI